MENSIYSGSTTKRFIKSLKNSKAIGEMKEAFGPHLTLDLSGCKRTTLTSMQVLYNLLDTLPGQIGMTKMTLPHVVEWLDKWADTPGYSGVVMLAESHIAIHTFPDSDYVFIDIFSCRHFDVDKAVNLFVKAFKPKNIVRNVVARGIDFPKPTHVVNNETVEVIQK